MGSSSRSLASMASFKMVRFSPDCHSRETRGVFQLQGLNTNQQILHRDRSKSGQGTQGRDLAERRLQQRFCGQRRRRRCNISALVSRSNEREAAVNEVGRDGLSAGGSWLFGTVLWGRREVWLFVRGRLIGEEGFVDCQLMNCTRCKEVDCLPGPGLIPSVHVVRWQRRGGLQAAFIPHSLTRSLPSEKDSQIAPLEHFKMK